LLEIDFGGDHRTFTHDETQRLKSALRWFFGETIEARIKVGISGLAN
jgi:hypothetical protein